MHAGEDPVEGGRYVRQVPLLPGESIEQLFLPQHGLVSVPTEKEDLLVLTNRRVIFFSQEEGNHRVTMMGADGLKGFTLRTKGRNPRHLYNGLLLMVAGILVYLLVGYFISGTLGVVVAAIAGAAVVIVGVFTAMRYLVWVEEGSIVFHSGGWDLTLRYHGQKAKQDAQVLLEHLFRIKQGTISHHPLDME